MSFFEFEIIVQTDMTDLETAANALYEGGCDDSFPGMGDDGLMSIEFTREAGSLHEAMQSALRDVKSSLPGAKLIQITTGD